MADQQQAFAFMTKIDPKFGKEQNMTYVGSATISANNFTVNDVVREVFAKLKEKTGITLKGEDGNDEWGYAENRLQYKGRTFVDFNKSLPVLNPNVAILLAQYVAFAVLNRVENIDKIKGNLRKVLEYFETTAGYDDIVKKHNDIKIKEKQRKEKEQEERDKKAAVQLKMLEEKKDLLRKLQADLVAIQEVLKSIGEEKNLNILTTLKTERSTDGIIQKFNYASLARDAENYSKTRDWSDDVIMSVKEFTEKNMKDINYVNEEIKLAQGYVLTFIRNTDLLAKEYIAERTQTYYGELKCPRPDAIKDVCSYNSNTFAFCEEQARISAYYNNQTNNEVADGIKVHFRRMRQGASIIMLGYGHSGSGKTFTLFGGGTAHPSVIAPAMASLCTRDPTESAEAPLLTGVTLTDIKIDAPYYTVDAKLYANLNPSVHGGIIQLFPTNEEKGKLTYFSNILGIRLTVSDLDLNIESKSVDLQTLKDADRISSIQTLIEGVATEVQKYLRATLRIRPTPNNLQSSRVHTFITLTCTFKNGTNASLIIVDMAGKESPNEILNLYGVTKEKCMDFLIQRVQTELPKKAGLKDEKWLDTWRKEYNTIHKFIYNTSGQNTYMPNGSVQTHETSAELRLWTAIPNLTSTSEHQVTLINMIKNLALDFDEDVLRKMAKAYCGILNCDQNTGKLSKDELITRINNQCNLFSQEVVTYKGENKLLYRAGIPPHLFFWYPHIAATYIEGHYISKSIDAIKKELQIRVASTGGIREQAGGAGDVKVLNQGVKTLSAIPTIQKTSTVVILFAHIRKDRPAGILDAIKLAGEVSASSSGQKSGNAGPSTKTVSRR